MAKNNLVKKILNGARSIGEKTILPFAFLTSALVYSDNANAQNVPDIQPHKSGTGWCADTIYYNSSSGWQKGKCPGGKTTLYSLEIPTLKTSDKEKTKDDKSPNDGNKNYETGQVNRSGLENSTYKVPTFRAVNKSGVISSVAGPTYFGQDYLFIADSTDLGIKEFYPMFDDKSITTFNSENGVLKDIKAKVTYIPEKLDSFNTIYLYGEESPLGINGEPAKRIKGTDPISSEWSLQSGQINEVLRISEFPMYLGTSKNGEDSIRTISFYTIYADTTKDIAKEVQVNASNYLPFLIALEIPGVKFLRADEQGNAYIVGNFYKLKATDKSDLNLVRDTSKMMMIGKAKKTKSDLNLVRDTSENSLIYNSSYLTNNIGKIRASVNAQGTPGHALRFANTEVPGDSIVKEEKKDLGFLINAEYSRGLVGQIGNKGELDILFPVGKEKRNFIGGYFAISDAIFSKNTNEQIPGGAQPVDENLPGYTISSPGTSKENIEYCTPLEVGLMFSGYSKNGKFAFDGKIGAISETTDKTIELVGTHYIKDETGALIRTIPYNAKVSYEDSKDLGKGGMAFSLGAKAYAGRFYGGAEFKYVSPRLLEDVTSHLYGGVKVGVSLGGKPKGKK